MFSDLGVLASIGTQIGVGKESDVYVASDDEGRQLAVKFHRLGRTCFRKVTEKRDYQGKNQNHKTVSWIYLSRLAAMREFAFMKILDERKILPIPQPIDYNRHCIVMEMIDGTILNQVAGDSMETSQVATLYEELMQIIITLANDFGVVHGDFNEFNILIKTNDNFKPIMIDFPQMVAVDHELAQEYFERDVNCIIDFFEKKFNYVCDTNPCFEIVKTQEDANTKDIKKLLEFMTDDNKLIEHLEKPVAQQSNLMLTQSEPTDIMSKFFSSLPVGNANVPPTSDDLYYEQPNEKLLQEAEDKVKLEKKMQNLQLTSIDENEPADFDTDPVPQLVTSLNAADDHGDRQSVHSHAYSTASTFSPMEVKARLQRERKKREMAQRNKFNPKNVKGDANALLRRKKNDQALANEDLNAYKDGSW